MTARREVAGPHVGIGQLPLCKRTSKYRVRSATRNDIDAIVEVDLQSFDCVYSEYRQAQEDLRRELRDKFLGRLDLIGGDWMPVLELGDRIVGFMMCCPTSKKPEEFESWERTTDNGTLRTTYDPDGRNIYVVTLSVLPQGTAGKDMILVQQVGKMLRDGYDLAYFESRLPGLRAWVLANYCDGLEPVLASLTPQQRAKYAAEYFEKTEWVHGKAARYDRLIRLYERLGCKLVRLVPDAYRDGPSLDFGVVCVWDGSALFDGSVLPLRLPQTRLTRWALGMAVHHAARSARVTRLLVT
jgi:hypothetical protein